MYILIDYEGGRAIMNSPLTSKDFRDRITVTSILYNAHRYNSVFEGNRFKGYELDKEEIIISFKYVKSLTFYPEEPEDFLNLNLLK